MFPSPCRMRGRTLPGTLLQMRLRKALSSIVVLSGTALAVVWSHFSNDYGIRFKRISSLTSVQCFRESPEAASSRTWKRRLIGYHCSRVSDAKYRANGIIDKHNIINSNRNTYRQISFRWWSCTAQDPPNAARISKIFCARPRSRPSLRYKSFFDRGTIRNRDPDDLIAIYCLSFLSTVYNRFNMIKISHCLRFKATLISAMLRETFAAQAVCLSLTR